MQRAMVRAMTAIVLAGAVATASPVANAQPLRGGAVITCPTVSIHVHAVGQHLVHVTGYLRVGNNSHVDGHNYYAQVKFWTAWQVKYFVRRGYLPPFKYDRWHISLYIRVPFASGNVHWTRRCYPT